MFAARSSLTNQRALMHLRRSAARMGSTPPSDKSAIPVSVAVPTGAVAGVLSSLCGIGGGVVIIPSLNNFSAMGPHAVAASSLFCVSIASTTSAASYLEQQEWLLEVVTRRASGVALVVETLAHLVLLFVITGHEGFTNVPLALTLMLTSVPGAAIGAQLAQRVSGPLLKRITASVMLCAAPVLWMSAEKKAKSLPHPAAASKDSAEVFDPQASQLEQSLKALRERNQIQWRAFTHNPALAVADAGQFVAKHWDFVLLGLGTGVGSGLIGIGGGLVMNMYMGVFTDMPQHEIVATSLLVVLPIGLSGTLVHWRAGRVNLRSCGVLAGVALGACGLTSRYLGEIDDAALKKLFTAVLAGSALNMLRR